MADKKVKTIVDAPSGKFFHLEPERFTLVADPDHPLSARPLNRVRYP